MFFSENAGANLTEKYPGGVRGHKPTRQIKGNAQQIISRITGSNLSGVGILLSRVTHSTFFASAVILDAKGELKGRKPLKTAHPPRVLGYSRTLAMLKAPEMKFTQLLLVMAWLTEEGEEREGNIVHATQMVLCRYLLG
jgi:hypothetical protein